MSLVVTRISAGTTIVEALARVASMREESARAACEAGHVVIGDNVMLSSDVLQATLEPEWLYLGGTRAWRIHVVAASDPPEASGGGADDEPDRATYWRKRCEEAEQELEVLRRSNARASTWIGAMGRALDINATWEETVAHAAAMREKLAAAQARIAELQHDYNVCAGFGLSANADRLAIRAAAEAAIKRLEGDAGAFLAHDIAAMLQRALGRDPLTSVTAAAEALASALDAARGMSGVQDAVNAVLVRQASGYYLHEDDSR